MTTNTETPPAACTMPEHGRPDATSPCCRPGAAAEGTPETTGSPSAGRAAQAGFWRDFATWRRASFNTAQCLLGCAIGDIAAMTLVPIAWPEIPLALLMAIAIVAGIGTSLALETVVLRVRERMPWPSALRIAWGMSLISMVAMELAMNITDWVAMGGERMPIHHAGYWLAWVPALVVGFLAPLPYNYHQLRRHGRACH